MKPKIGLNLNSNIIKCRTRAKSRWKGSSFNPWNAWLSSSITFPNTFRLLRSWSRQPTFKKKISSSNSRSSSTSQTPIKRNLGSQKPIRKFWTSCWAKKEKFPTKSLFKRLCRSLLMKWKNLSSPTKSGSRMHPTLSDKPGSFNIWSTDKKMCSWRKISTRTNLLLMRNKKKWLSCTSSWKEFKIR